ncbi:MAG: class I SAM-dependent methyltransferase [Clostridia bacterium]|nr:class I SAM-dependent methyltransferase [Clostridia bacterium]
MNENIGSEIGKEYWNQWYEKNTRDSIIYDEWLNDFYEYIKKCEAPIIDLGCGSGNDTKWLIENGKKVIPCDYSTKAIENMKINFPEVDRIECFDMRNGLPFEDNFTDIIIADLSLHYFSKEETNKILNELKRVLRKAGMLILRVNSVKDVNHGAGEGEEIERHFYKIPDGRYKRFFDKEDLDYFFKEWKCIYIKEEQMTRYEKTKELWKCAYKVEK